MSEYQKNLKQTSRQNGRDPWEYDGEPPWYMEVYAWLIAVVVIGCLVTVVAHLWNY